MKCSIKLDGNESPYDLYPDLKDIILKDLEELQLNRYPDPDFLSIKSKLANLHSITEEGILLGNGSDEIIQMLITVFSGKSGKILVPSPTFSMYKLTGIALNKEVLETDLDEDFDLDLNEILKTIDNEDPDLIFFATPNNPTGNSFSKKKILEILENTNAIVIIDEAYFDYSKDTFLPYMEKYDQLMILRTMSKIGLASLRLGFLFGQPDLIKELNKARLPYNINSFSQSLMNIVLDNLELIENNVEEIIAEREKLKNKLSKISGFKVYPSDANFFFIKTQDADFLFNELVKKDILIRNFNKPGRLENCVRITIGTPSENEYLIQALKGIFSD
ncbi:MAG: histidinol-phosphate transaminase [Candidatus Dadabacteria bacterium]|nr:histidinol-phosphate transaminase [Candidatus Dadabacteria bacterium]NIQ13548.1 histidinol-phosphate transaminase [Candidatus Dadabacteria bacterium]